jgi:hypothetical protein
MFVEQLRVGIEGLKKRLRSLFARSGRPTESEKILGVLTELVVCGLERRNDGAFASQVTSNWRV